MGRSAGKLSKPGGRRRGQWQRRIGRRLWVPFDIGVRALYPIVVRGRDNFTEAPSTLVVSNHRRDSDGPVIASVMLRRRGLRVFGVRPYFVAREDLFRRGFLAGYLSHWPAPLRAALAQIDLSALFESMQALPMRRIPERSLGEVLEDVLATAGNCRLDEVLKPACLNEFMRRGRFAAGTARIADVLDARFDELLARQRGFSRLNRSSLHRLIPYERHIIDAYLDRLSRLLDDGATLILEPEGAVSFDGRLSRLRGALHSLLNRTRARPRVLPIGITYDSMTEDRKSVFVNIGEEMSALQGLGRAETDTRVATAIRRCMTVTCSQLASDYLWTVRRNGGRELSRADLDDYVTQAAARFAAARTPVDERLLHEPSRSRCLGGYLACCLRRGILTARSARRYHMSAACCEAKPDASRAEGIVGYMCNELAAVPSHSV